MDRKYFFFVLVLFAAVMALVYLANYVSAVLDDTDALIGKWYYLVGGLVYLFASMTMFTYEKVGWYLYMLGLLLTIFIALFVSFSLESLPVIVMALFLILFLWDDSVKKTFGVTFSVKVKL